jgi:FMN phosphatase YigB (HAD superfamily)
VYTILDLKDAFFSLPLAEVSQPIFAFEWTDLEEGFPGQLTWMRLPQGFKNSSTLFDEALTQDLIVFRAKHPGVVLLQYVDDLLLAAETKNECREATEDLLKDLGGKVYCISDKKAQLYTPLSTYLGCDLTQGK